MGLYSDNFYSWLDRQNAIEKATMDAAFNEEDHPREGKGKEGGGRFAKKPETLAKEDVLDPGHHSKKQSSSAKEQTSGSKYRKLRDTLADKVKEKGTYDLETGTQITNRTEGYQVSFQEETTESPEYGSYIPDKEYDRKVEALREELGARPELGHWDENEISFHVTSLDKAIEVARRHNQEAIWNWKKGEAIYNPDFVGRTHWRDRDNHTKKYLAHKASSGNNN